MNIILTGFMGTGKTAVGKRLAQRLGWRFVDVDQLIEAGAKMPVARIFAERGETVFRRLERRCITRAVHGDRQVIATGGGAFIDRDNRAKLRASGPVICLTARPSVILERVGRGLKARPLLAGSPHPLARIRMLLAQRASAYAKADLAFDTSDCAIDEVAERVWRELSPHLCRSWRYILAHAQQLALRYGGKYVVVVEERVVACGQTQLEAYRNASNKLGGAPDAGIYYIPSREEPLTVLTAQSQPRSGPGPGRSDGGWSRTGSAGGTGTRGGRAGATPACRAECGAGRDYARGAP